MLEETVVAARSGDRESVAALVEACLPLLYNVVGRALDGHPDVDDVVQETVVKVLRGLPALREPAKFRSWLIAIAVRQIRDHQAVRREVADRHTTLDRASAPDFADLTVLRLGLSGERREIAEATRWLDPSHRETLSLWWLEQAGELTRADLAVALELPPAQVAVRVQRMREQLDTARSIVRVLKAETRCPGLPGWDGEPSSVARKRFARHIAECRACSGAPERLIPAERLLAGILLVPVPVEFHPLPRLAARQFSAPSSGGGFGKGLGLGKSAIAVPAVAASVAGVIAFGTLHGSDARPAANVTSGPSAAVTAGAGRTPQTGEPAAAKPKAAPKAAPKPGKACLKGVASWRFSASKKALKASGACWFYSWGVGHDGIASPSGVEFVPMIRAASDVKDVSRAKGRYLLGFNEPDLREQANMTVEQALDLWPRLMRTGKKLGSPAVAVNAAAPGGWLDRFLRGAAARHYRVDFVTVHWYGYDFRTKPAVSQLRSYLTAVHKRYGKPIWLTEYALMNFGGGPKYPSPKNQAAFITASAKMIGKLPYVQRYAWFGLPSTPDSGTGLYRADGTPTAMGTAFRRAPRTR
ncbi:hypothetical protein GCM10010468_10500 [Actinocorallia longicatena]|uniref:RNA polymerase sigma factor n=2 Tax=Actinocorallia longicatena TaxID=111803 RepID=A0ABP6Q115_9ACTN